MAQSGGHSPYLLLLVLIAALGSLQFGFHLAELNAPEEVLTCRSGSGAAAARRFSTWTRFVLPSARDDSRDGWLPECIPMSEAAFAAVQSIFTVGGLAGALSAGPISSRRGRLPTMRLTALIAIAGGLVEALAPAVTVLSLGRLIAGLAAGASTVIVPLYISEVSPPSARGLYGAMTQISINVGIVAGQGLGLFLSHDGAWRWIFAASSLIAVIQAVGLLVVPESPAWLAAHGHREKARETLLKIRGGPGAGSLVDEEIRGLGMAAEPEEEASLLGPEVGVPEPSVGGAVGKDSHSSHLGFFQVLQDKLYRPAIVAVVGVMFVQQICGINSIVMYSVSLFNDLLPTSSALISVLIALVNLVTTVACSPLPDRLGRKTCLLLSVVGQGTSSLVLALSIMYGFKVLSAVSVFAFVAAFAVGLGPVPFILPSEMVGQDAVGATQSWALASNYVATFLVAQFFPLVNRGLNDALGGAGWVYFLFAAMAGLSAAFVSWRVPETRGKKDLDEVWGRSRRLD